MADFPKKQQQCLIPKYLLDYTTELNKNHPDPSDPWGGGGGSPIEAGTGIVITGTDTKTISLDTNPDTFEVTADTGMTLEVENSNPLWKDSKLQMANTGSTRLEGTQISLEANNIYLNSDNAPYYVNNTTHEYKTLATTDQLFSGDYDDLYNKPTIPDAVSGTNDGTNWTSLTIGNDTYGLASGGGTTYTAGNGIDITNNEISIDTSVVAEVSDIPTKTSDLTNDSGFITGINSTDVINALGYTPGTSNFSGDYDDLTNKPTIPTATSQLTNDSGFITNDDQNVEYIFVTSTSSTPQTFTLTTEQVDAIILNPTKYIIVYEYQPADVYANRIYFKYQFQRTISNNIYFYYASIDYYPFYVSITNGTHGYRFKYVTFSLATTGTNKGIVTVTNSTNTYQKALTLGTGLSHSGDEISVDTSTIATRTWVGQQGYSTFDGDYNSLTNKPTIPTVNDPTITFTQGGVNKGTITLNQSSNQTIALDAGSTPSNMVTTDTDQTITGKKTIVGSTVGLYVQNGSTYTEYDTKILPGEISTSSISSHAAYSNEYAMADAITTTQGQLRVRDFHDGSRTDYYITVPTKNGTMALTSDIVTSYNDLTNKPDLSIYAQSANLATVATSGSYNDLSNKPTIPTTATSTVTASTDTVVSGVTGSTTTVVSGVTYTPATETLVFTYTDNTTATITLLTSSTTVTAATTTVLDSVSSSTATVMTGATVTTTLS